MVGYIVYTNTRSRGICDMYYSRCALYYTVGSSLSLRTLKSLISYYGKLPLRVQLQALQLVLVSRMLLNRGLH
jgi:hypothetical protein